MRSGGMAVDNERLEDADIQKRFESDIDNLCYLWRGLEMFRGHLKNV